MNSGNGSFAMLTEDRANMVENALLPFIKKGKLKGSGVFRVGEKVELNGCNFEVVNISTHKLSLRLLPDDRYQQIPKQ